MLQQHKQQLRCLAYSCLCLATPISLNLIGEVN